MSLLTFEIRSLGNMGNNLRLPKRSVFSERSCCTCLLVGHGNLFVVSVHKKKNATKLFHTKTNFTRSLYQQLSSSPSVTMMGKKDYCLSST